MIPYVYTDCSTILTCSLKKRCMPGCKPTPTKTKLCRAPWLESIAFNPTGAFMCKPPPPRFIPYTAVPKMLKSNSKTCGLQRCQLHPRHQTFPVAPYGSWYGIYQWYIQYQVQHAAVDGNLRGTVRVPGPVQQALSSHRFPSQRGGGGGGGGCQYYSTVWYSIDIHLQLDRN